MILFKNKTLNIFISTFLLRQTPRDEVAGKQNFQSSYFHIGESLHVSTTTYKDTERGNIFKNSTQVFSEAREKYSIKIKIEKSHP